MKTKIHKEAVIHNENTQKTDWILISILKTSIIKHKISLDIDNVKVGNPNLTKRILERRKRRLETPLPNPLRTEALDKLERYLKLKK